MKVTITLNLIEKKKERANLHWGHGISRTLECARAYILSQSDNSFWYGTKVIVRVCGFRQKRFGLSEYVVATLVFNVWSIASIRAHCQSCPHGCVSNPYRYVSVAWSVGATILWSCKNSHCFLDVYGLSAEEAQFFAFEFLPYFSVLFLFDTRWRMSVCYDLSSYIAALRNKM